MLKLADGSYVAANCSSKPATPEKESTSEKPATEEQAEVAAAETKTE